MMHMMVSGKSPACIMTERPVRILHLSDFHFDAERDGAGNPVFERLAMSVKTLVSDGLGPDLVVITGDIANKGRVEDYVVARHWIDAALLPALPHSFTRDRFLIIPGNHDVDRRRITKEAVHLQKKLLENQTESGISDTLNNPSALSALLDRHTPYVEFRNQLRMGEARAPLPWWSTTVNLGGSSIFIAGACSSWMCIGDDKGKLLLSRHQMWDLLPQGFPTDADVSLLLLHHPVSYLADFDAQALKPLIGKFDLYLRGHLHEEEAALREEPDSGSVELAAGAAYGGQDYPNSYQLIEVFNRERVLRVHYRVWQYGHWIPFSHVFEDAPYGIVLLTFGRNHTRRANKKELNPWLCFRRAIFERGISSKNPLVEVLDGEPITERHAAVTAAFPRVDQVESELEHAHVVVLAGEHGSGKSSVAFSVARRFYGNGSRGYERTVYVYLRRRPMAIRDLEALERQIRTQVGPVLLIFDDFHLYGSNAMLNSLRAMATKRCKILIVISVDRWESGELQCPSGAIMLQRRDGRESLRSWAEANASLIAETLGETKETIMERAAVAEESDTTAYGFVVSLSGGQVRLATNLTRLGQAYWERWRVLLAICLHMALVEEEGITWSRLQDLTRLKWSRLRSVVRELSRYARSSKRFIVLGHGDHLRTPHVGLAGAVLKLMGGHVLPEERNNFERFLDAVVEAAVRRAGTPDRAIQRLVSRLFTYGIPWLAEPILNRVELRPYATPEFSKQLAFTFHLLGARNAAQKALEKAKEGFRNEGNPDQSIRCAYWCTFLRFHQGQWSEALDIYEELMRAARKREELRDLIPKIHRDRAQIFAVFASPKDLQKAEAEAKAAVYADRVLGLHPGWSHCWLAQVHLLQRRYKSAFKDLRRGRIALKRLPDPPEVTESMEVEWRGEPDQNPVRQKRDGLFWNSYVTALLHQNKNHFARALYWYEHRCIPEARFLSNAYGAALCYAQMGGIWYRKGDRALALRHFARAHQLFESCGAQDEVSGPAQSQPEFKGLARWIARLSRWQGEWPTSDAAR